MTNTLFDPAVANRRAQSPSPSRPGEDTAHRRAPWTFSLVALGLGLAVLLVLFWRTAWSMGDIWWTSQTFSHGFLIFPISACLIWMRRADLARCTPRPSWLGVGVVGAAALAWLVGDIAGVQGVQQFALVAMIQGLVLAVLGLRATSVIAFPLLYLYFAVPFGSFLIAPLQDLTAAFVVRVLQIVGIPIYLDGLFLYIPSGSFEVAAACAGLRFLITSVALSVLFAHVFYREWWRRALFLGFAVIVPIIANGFRASGIVLVAHYSDYKYAAGVDHITYGLVFLSLVLFCLLALGYLFREKDERPRNSSATGADVRKIGAAASPVRTAIAVALTMTIAGAANAYAGYIAQRPASAPGMTLSLPQEAAAWRKAPPAHADWRPSFPNVDDETFQGYATDTRQVDLYVAYYTSQRQGAEVVNWNNNLAGAAPWNRAGSGWAETGLETGPKTAPYERIVAPGERRRIVWYWFWVDGQLTSSRYVAKLLEVKAKLLGGRPEAAVIAVAADYRDRPREAMQTLARFVGDTALLTTLLGAPGS